MTLADLRTAITADWRANRADARWRCLLALFRLAQYARGAALPIRLALLPARALYQLCTMLFAFELYPPTRVGPGLRVRHGQALVVHASAVIGPGCTLRNSVTIGVKLSPDGSASAAPILGEHVDVGANAVIIGPIRVGDRAVIGAGAVVVKDVPADAVVAGNPARIIGMRRESSS